MAEGFISYQDKGPSETLREVAQRYLTELAMRSMVQLYEAEIYTPLKKFDRCGLHDLMHDFISSKAEEENFLNHLDAPKYLCGIPSATGTRLALLQSIDNSISRLSISYVLKTPVSSINGLDKLKDLRSFMLFSVYITCPLIVFKDLFLDQVIIVVGGEKLRLDGLDELETLVEVRSETVCIADIPKLISLRTLSVKVDNVDVDSMSIVLSNKNSLLRETHSVVVSCDLNSDKGIEVLNDGLMSSSLVTLEMDRCNMGGCFPYYKQGMCQNLVSLELKECKVKVDVMEFGKYPMLQTLSLSSVERTETLVCHSNSFPQLKRLQLYDLQDLKQWEVEEIAMPKLAYLEICDCYNLEKIPDGLRFISSFHDMRIFSMPREFMERVKEEDYAPSICQYTKESSHLFNDECRGEGPTVIFEANDTQYNRAY
ncbi:probable disease resistance protein RF45 [Salvia hispanica]|uniref:probable disease resistance protein RF45 n=1 Tax=Salvia hispanica TaxID=49212 RepID=UPI002008F662|nr:probable disease resistance protein RF45 [Salvia hispanica]